MLFQLKLEASLALGLSTPKATPNCFASFLKGQEFSRTSSSRSKVLCSAYYALQPSLLVDFACSQISRPSGLFSRGFPSVSYARPSVRKLEGCNRSGAPSVTAVVGCERSGTPVETITVTGSNLGASRASVLIAGEECTNVVHDVSNPHTKLTCDLPPGAGLSRNLLVLQYRGEISEEDISVSYKLCPKGTSTDEGGITCTPCSPGKFNNLLSIAGECRDCPAGRCRAPSPPCTTNNYSHSAHAQQTYACPVSNQVL